MTLQYVHLGDDDGLNRGALHIMFMWGSPSTSTTTSGGEWGKNNYDSNEFEKNNYLMVYLVSYNIKTYDVQAYSTCSYI